MNGGMLPNGASAQVPLTDFNTQFSQSDYADAQMTEITV